MLGKRCRTIQRTASISQNMGPHYLHHHNYHQQHDVTAATKAINHADAIVLGHHAHAGNSQVPAIIPQIIGFNPMIRSANYAGGGDHEVSQQPKLIGPSADFNGTVSPPPPNLHGRPQPHDMYDDDPKHHNTRGAGSSGSPSTKRSQITPRSALQTLLAAARQITYSDQSSASNANNYPCKSSEVASKSSFKNNPTSPSCSSNSTVSAAKQGSFIWQGLTVLGEATISKELPSSKQFMSTPKASKPVIATQAKGAHAPHEFSQNYNIINEAPPHEYIHNVQSMSEVDSENIFDVEGTSSHSGGAIGHPISCFEPTEDHHALYLATSPLTADFIPNLATSMSFLDSCYLCKRPLGQGRDIFMYRGENAFCSMECRDKQMRLEDRKEKMRSIHSQMNKLNVQKQGLHVKSSNAGMGSTSTNTTSCYHPHQQPPHSKHLPHHRQQYAANHSQQAVAYNNKQHRISLLMPAA